MNKKTIALLVGIVLATTLAILTYLHEGLQAHFIIWANLVIAFFKTLSFKKVLVSLSALMVKSVPVWVRRVLITWLFIWWLPRSWKLRVRVRLRYLRVQLHRKYTKTVEHLRSRFGKSVLFTIAVSASLLILFGSAALTGFYIVFIFGWGKVLAGLKPVFRPIWIFFQRILFRIAFELNLKYFWDKIRIWIPHPLRRPFRHLRLWWRLWVRKGIRDRRRRNDRLRRYREEVVLPKVAYGLKRIKRDKAPDPDTEIPATTGAED